MNWKRLLFLPLAALAVGTQARTPALKEEIPLTTEGSCAYEYAKESFLLAYAYRYESAQEMKKNCRIAIMESNECGAEAAILKGRVHALCDP